MKKFSEYANNNASKTARESTANSKQNTFEFLKKVASKYEGASEAQLISAILSEAKTAREKGQLSDEDIENFVATISPMLSQAQRAQLKLVVEQIKNSN